MNDERDYWSDLRAIRGCAASPEVKHLLLVLVTYCRQDSCFPSISCLTRDLGLSERAVQRRIREAENAGWISTETRSVGGRNTSNRYRINFDRAYHPVVDATPVVDAGGGGVVGDTLPPVVGDTPLMTSLNHHSESPKGRVEVSGDKSLTLTEAMRVEWPNGFDEVIPRWGDWLRFRHSQKKRVFTKVGLEIQIRKLVEMGPQGAIKAIEHSMSQGYQGIFQPKSAAGGRDNLGPEDEGSISFHRVSPAEARKLADQCERELAERERWEAQRKNGSPAQ